MSLRPNPLPPVPEETARMAHAAFPKGNTYLRLREELGPLSEDTDLAALFPRRGQPGLSPRLLARVTSQESGYFPAKGEFAFSLQDRCRSPD